MFSLSHSFPGIYDSFCRFSRRILATVICGFVGSTMARGLREGRPDWEFVGLDNLVRAGSEMNRRILRELGIKLYHGGVRSPSDLETLPGGDWIIEAAANRSVLAGVAGKTSSRRLIEHNLVGTINMLELLKQWCRGFTILSTSRVHSIPALGAIPMGTQGDRFVPSTDASRIAHHRSGLTPLLPRTKTGLFMSPGWSWIRGGSLGAGAGSRRRRSKPFGPKSPSTPTRTPIGWTPLLIFAIVRNAKIGLAFPQQKLIMSTDCY